MKDWRADCPYCGGGGWLSAPYKVRYNTLSPPDRECPVCRGLGWVDEDKVDEIDITKPPDYYDEIDEQAYADDKYDFLKDEGLL